MNEINKILVGICFSRYCLDTLLFATKLAQRLEAQLIIANIINVRDVEQVSQIEAMGFAVDAAAYIRGVEEEREKSLNEMIQVTGYPSDQIKAVFRVGHPDVELLKLIDEKDIDMVVIGKKGNDDIEHAMMGSVAKRVIRHSPVTVVSHRKRD